MNIISIQLSILPFLNGSKAVDVARLCLAVLALNLFKVDHHYLYYWVESKGFWKIIPPGDEIVMIRRLFSEEDQRYINSHIPKQIVDWLKTHPSLQIDFASCQNPYLVNLQNGTFNLTTGKLLPHNREFYMTTVLDAAYVWPDSSRFLGSPAMDKFCEEVFSGKVFLQKRQLLYQIIGLTVSNISDGKKALFMIGPSNCGKSVILNFTEKIIGPSSASRLSLLNFADRFSTADLLGKTANLSSEIPVEPVPAKAFDVFKSLVGHDPIFAEKKGKDGFEFTFQGTLLFAGNVMPTFKSVDGTNALINRMVLLVFNNEVPKERQNPDMLEELYKERDIIISNALMEMKALIESKYNFSMGADEYSMIRNYEETVNTVSSFFQHVCAFEDGALTTINEAYRAYLNYTSLIGVEPEKRLIFRKKMLTDPRVTLESKHRINGQGPRACFGGFKIDYSVLYENNQDTEKCERIESYDKQ